jgi:hypothetical protein
MGRKGLSLLLALSLSRVRMRARRFFWKDKGARNRRVKMGVLSVFLFERGRAVGARVPGPKKGCASAAHGKGGGPWERGQLCGCALSLPFVFVQAAAGWRA